MKRFIILLILLLPVWLFAQDVIEIGTFNIEWFPCKDDGEMMKKYDIYLSYPPTGASTDTLALFEMLKELDIELLGVQEIVDPTLFRQLAKNHLGEHYEFIWAGGNASQKVGFLYNSQVLQLVGQSQVYMDVALSANSRLRPAFRAYFKTLPDGFDFHAIVTHLKAAPSGWKTRQKQWDALLRILENVPKESGDSDVILLGDFNNVSRLQTAEFADLVDGMQYFRTTAQNDSLASNYWTPDYKTGDLRASLIDHIFVSPDAKIELLPASIRVGGGCAAGAAEYKAADIPEYFLRISDHCPVFVSFRSDLDND